MLLHVCLKRQQRHLTNFISERIIKKLSKCRLKVLLILCLCSELGNMQLSCSNNRNLTSSPSGEPVMPGVEKKMKWKCTLLHQLSVPAGEKGRLFTPVDTALILQLTAQSDELSSVELMQMLFRFWNTARSLRWRSSWFLRFKRLNKLIAAKRANTIWFCITREHI